MKFIPYETHTIATSLSKQEIYKKLKSSITNKFELDASFFSSKRYQVPFEGIVNSDTFKISKRLENRTNSWKPIIIGTIENRRITFKMRMSVYTSLFMIVYLGLLGTILIAISFSEAKELKSIFILLAMFVLSYSLMFFAFKSESKRILTFLKKLLAS